jgi:hypothetical protein
MLILPEQIKLSYGEHFAYILTFTLDREKELTTESGTLQAIWGIDRKWHPDAFQEVLSFSDTARLIAAAKFYYHRFWLPVIRLDSMVPQMQFLFDTAVNQGLTTAEQIAQPSTLLPILGLRRIKRYTETARLPNKQQYLRGWVIRVLDLLDYVRPQE